MVREVRRRGRGVRVREDEGVMEYASSAFLAASAFSFSSFSFRSFAYKESG